jgi:hypothetical protein
MDLGMGRFRKVAIAGRLAIGAFAVYALLLQGVLTASAPAAGLADGVICAADGSGQGTSGSAPAGHHHGLCCTLACAAAACAYTGAASPLVFLPVRSASIICLAPPPVLAARPLLNYCFSARGPPEEL